jgi:hypothetical protein
MDDFQFSDQKQIQQKGRAAASEGSLPLAPSRGQNTAALGSDGFKAFSRFFKAVFLKAFLP